MAAISRWTAEEVTKLAEMREILGEQLHQAGQYPEVIGDRKLLRFLRGHDHSVAKACEMMSNFLTWRREACIDDIRRNIIEKGMNHPSLFPNAKKILDLVPQIVIAHDALDNYGSPISLEQYSFSPSNVLKLISLSEYLEFITYTLEFKSMVLEQMSEAMERRIVENLSSNRTASRSSDAPVSVRSPTSTKSSAEISGKSPKDGKDSGKSTSRGSTKVSPQPEEPCYGVLLNMCVLRDLSSIGWEHIGAQGQEIIGKVQLGYSRTTSYLNVPEMSVFTFYSYLCTFLRMCAQSGDGDSYQQLSGADA